MNSTIVIGVLGGIILVGFFAYNIYDSFLRKDSEDEDASKNA